MPIEEHHQDVPSQGATTRPEGWAAEAVHGHIACGLGHVSVREGCKHSTVDLKRPSVGDP